MLHKIIIEHLYTASQGLIKITKDQANDIINLVTNYRPAYAVKSRYAQGNRIEVVRTITTTLEAINEAILNALESGPTHGFYKYDLYNDKQELQGSIFTINPNLFD